MNVYRWSRRTIMSGEVVTFAPAFTADRNAFGPYHDAKGPFEVSASRDAVMVHRAECCSAEASAALMVAIQLAEEARVALGQSWMGGAPSLYAKEPTLVFGEGEAARPEPQEHEAQLVVKGGDNIAQIIELIQKAGYTVIKE
jgi:hypothetical protein